MPTVNDLKIAPGEVGRLWLSIGRVPADSEIDAHAAKYSVIVLNPWNTNQAARIHRVSPKTIVLAYKCLASTRSYTTDKIVPAGIRYQDATDEMFALDQSGKRFEWGPYAGHWQMSIGNAAYQLAWTNNVATEIGASEFDGVFADNDMQTIKWYTPKLLKGTSNQSQTDTAIRSGTDALIAKAGKALNDKNKILIPNISDGRLSLARWKAHAAYGGGMDEMFLHWGTDDNSGYVTDWGATGWLDQTSELESGLTLCVTTPGASDRALRYSYGSALVRAKGRVAWTPHRHVNYDTRETFAWQDAQIGKPQGAGYVRNGIYRRRFEKAFVAVNPTTAAYDLTLPRAFGGKKITVPATDAILVPAA